MENLKQIYKTLFMPEYIKEKFFNDSDINILGSGMLGKYFVAVVEEKTKGIDYWEDFI